jgi:hypothetical protein
VLNVVIEDGRNLYTRFQYAKKFVSNDDIGWTCALHSETEEKTGM